MQVILALTEGQKVLVLTRKELEAVPSGKRLAQLLQNKRAHLVGRQDIYEAEPEELRQREGGFRRGREAFYALMRSERLRRIEEAQGRQANLPDGDAARAAAVRAALEAVEPLIAARRNDPGLDPRWMDVREALMAATVLCVGWLAELGFEHANTILSNVAMTGVDRLRARVGSRLWDVLSGYYSDELLHESPESFHESLLFGLTGMLVEEILNLDEYWPEPDDE